MRASILPSPLLRQALLASCIFSALSATGLWAVVIIREWPRLMAGGTLCGAEPIFLGHCPACFPAVAATLMAAGFAAALGVQKTLDRA